MAQFDVLPTRPGEPGRLTVSGEVDASVAEGLVRIGSDCLAADAPELVMDLGAVTFLDSTGVGALVAVRERALELGKTVSVVNPSSPVTKVLRITGLSDVF